MLPSTGLFKSIVCPLYETSACNRPYCHFKHAKKEDEIELNKPAVYNPSKKPTPILLTLSEPVTKKPKLEYTPTKPAINDAPSKHNYNIEEKLIPVYVPSNSINIPRKDSTENSELIDTGKTEVEICADPDPSADCKNEERVEKTKNGFIKDEKSDDVDVEIIHKVESILKDESNVEAESIVQTESVVQAESKDDEPKRDKHHKNKDSSSKEKSKDRENSSASQTDKKSSKSSESTTHHRSKSSKHKSSDKERDKHKDKHKSHSKHSSKSKSHHRERSRSSSRSRKKEKDKDKDKDRKHKSESSKSSSSKSKSEKSSKSSSNHVSEKSSSKSQDKIKEKQSKIPSPIAIEDSEEEDEVMRQCKLIFGEDISTTPETANLLETIKSADIGEDKRTESKKRSHDQRTHSESQSNPAFPQFINIGEKYQDANKKRRLAHENASNTKTFLPPAPKRANHIQNAMRAVYERQEIARKQKEQEEAAALAALKDAEQKVKEDIYGKQATATTKTSQSGLSISRGLTLPTKTTVRSIAPVSNILALNRAKQKIDMLKAERQPTPTQSTKGSSRAAHNSKVDVDVKPAPPPLEPNSTKINFNVRMMYYNMMVEHCLNMYPDCDDAWERAQTEELAVLEKCKTALIYKKSALLTINKLKKEALDSGNKNVDKNKVVSHEVILAGKLSQNSSWSVNKKIKTDASSQASFDKLPGKKAYEVISELILPEEKLRENGFPRPGFKKGTATIANLRSVKPPSETERYCSRCSKLFNLSLYDYEATDECNYHPKGTGYRRGFADNFHFCCQQLAGSPGCLYANYHVSDYVDYDNLTGFVTTVDRGENYTPTRSDIYALDCEMCYTTHGLELTRVTVVDINCSTVYDALVKPENKIIDYNTVYSGISEEMLANEKRTIADVQSTLLSMFHSKTIIIGHSLESDMKALKLIHNTIVDTSVLFPHKMGPPKRRALKTLCVEMLKKIIQENEGGHDSAEDATVCIELVKYYLRNRIV